MGWIMMALAVILKKFTNWFKYLTFLTVFFVFFTNDSLSLKTICYITFLFLTSSSLYSQQFYIRGEIKDESGNLLQNVSILHDRLGYVYYTGSSGSFGFSNNRKTDTLTFSLDGYQKERRIMNADNFISVRLKRLPTNANSMRRSKLASMTKNLAKDKQREWFAGDETYASIIENRFVNAKLYPATGLALNIDRASYSNVRRFLNMNTQIPPDAVRIEEMLNYFNTNYHEPAAGQIFNMNAALTHCPWNAKNQLFFLNVSSKKIQVDSLPPTHLVFLIDISGSMDMPSRLPLLKSAFRLLVNNLRQKDTVSIVVYGGTVGIMLNPTCGNEKGKILKAIDELISGGSTPGESGIRMAYSVARNHFIKGGNNRVILATDGDFNVGLKSETDLEDLISAHRESGIYLTCIGVGMGNYKDSKIEALAKRGNGNFAYLDDIKEGEKILVKELTQTLYAVANDVTMDVQFNPDMIKEYRLIGYDNKRNAIADSANTLEGGEIGSACGITAVFEIVPADYFFEEEPSDTQTIARLSLNYRLPADSANKCDDYTCVNNYQDFEKISPDLKFATSLTMLGLLLKDSKYASSVSWSMIQKIAKASKKEDDYLQNEFLTIVENAEKIYSKKGKKKVKSRH